MLRTNGLSFVALAVAAFIGMVTPGPGFAQAPPSIAVSEVAHYFPELAWPPFVEPVDIPFVDPGSPNALAVALANEGKGTEALDAFLALAENGDVAAKVNAGVMLLQGRQVPPDFNKAIELLRSAADQGDGFASLALAGAFLIGSGVPSSYADMYEALQRAAATPAAPEAEFFLSMWQHMATGDISLNPPHCSKAYAAGHRLAVDQCLDHFTDLIRDPVQDNIRQHAFAVRLAPWFEGTNIQRQYVDALFWDSNTSFRTHLSNEAVMWEEIYKQDSQPFIDLIGTSKVRAFEAQSGGAEGEPLAQEPDPVEAGVVEQAEASRADDANAVLARHVSDICETGPATLRDGALYEPDLNMDGQPDMVLDLGFVDCGNGERSDTCGFRTCRILVFLRSGPELELVDTLTSIGAEIVDGAPPRIKLMTHDFEEYQVAWDGSRFSELDVNAGPASGTATPVSGSWEYGEHPILGLSAYVELEGEVVGITCAYHGDNPAVVGLSSIRVTPGLVRDGQITMLLQPSRAGGTSRLSPGEGFFEVTGNSCDLNTLEWRNGSSVAILDKEITGMSSVADGVLFEFEDGQTLSPEDPVEAKVGVLTIPLKGSAKAIDQLLNACPMLKQDIEWNCGI